MLESTFNNIISAHPESVRFLLKNYGITAKPTAQLLYSSYLQYGNGFLKPLLELAWLDHQSVYSNADGDSKKQSFFSGFKNVLDKAVEISTDIKTASETLGGIVGGSTTSAQQKELEALEQERKNKQAKNMLYLGFGFIAVLLVLIVVKKKK